VPAFLRILRLREPLDGAVVLLDPSPRARRSRDGAHLCWFGQAGKNREFGNVELVRAPRLFIGNVGEPFELRRHVGKIAILSRCRVLLGTGISPELMALPSVADTLPIFAIVEIKRPRN
jgi:hypothetical protein